MNQCHIPYINYVQGWNTIGFITIYTSKALLCILFWSHTAEGGAEKSG
jgi:hypothetical protein